MYVNILGYFMRLFESPTSSCNFLLLTPLMNFGASLYNAEMIDDLSMNNCSSVRNDRL